MTFWKTTFWATVATVARLISQFVMAKLVALFAGPAAFGIIGQFQSFVSITQLGSGSIVNSGLVKYSSEFHSNPDKLEKLIHTVFKVVFIASVITGLLISIFSTWISEWVFQDAQYYWVFILFGCTLFGYTLNQLFMSLFNGLNEMRKYTIMTVAGAVLSIVISGLLVFYYKINGYFYGLVASQCCLFCVSLFYIHRIPAKVKLLKARIDPEMLKKLLHFSLMAVTSAISLPLAQMIIRLHVVEHSSWAEVGYWQAVLRISDAYLMIITTIIGTYALPKYARISEKKILKQEVLSVMTKVVPAAAVFAFGVYYFRHWVVLILFSSDFVAAESLFGFQLMGDIAKIASWVIGNVLLAKGQVKTYIALELLFTSSLLMLSIYCFDYFGIGGLPLAFCINYIGCFLIVLIWLIYFLSRGRSL